MRRIMLVLTIVCMLAATGCQFVQDNLVPISDTPRKRLKLAWESWELANDTISDLARADALEPDDIETILEYKPRARRALQAWDRAVRRDDDPGVHPDAFEEALLIIQEILEDYQNDAARTGDVHPPPDGAVPARPGGKQRRSLGRRTGPGQNPGPGGRRGVRRRTARLLRAADRRGAG